VGTNDGSSKREIHRSRLLKRIRHRRAVQRARLKKNRRLKLRKKKGAFGYNREGYSDAPKNRLVLSTPERLDFATDATATRGFFFNLSEYIRRSKTRTLNIDHSTLRHMSPSAALVLIAEMFRLNKRYPDCKKICKMPLDLEICNLLGSVGYFEYFPAISWAAPQIQTRFYLSHRSGTFVDSEQAARLTKHFSDSGNLTSGEIQTLYAAIVECMQNVSDHAYDREDHYKYWWLLGYRDSQTHEISFCFYDQGVGIPETIRVRLRDKLLFPPTDAELIAKAVIEGKYSRTKKKTRGNGLPALRQFVTTARKASLEIDSKGAKCVFLPIIEGSDNKDGLKPELRGTLISWRVSKW
jgi:hypothetical protein